MMPTVRRSAERLALVLGFLVGAWLVPLASTAGDAPVSPGGTALQAAAPERLYLAQAATVPVEKPVSYASEQADRGEERYAKDCVECHGGDLKGGMNGGPPLRGLAFEEKYFGDLPASVMFAFMSSTMPPNAPGRYSENTYADLLAYILKRNGFNAGAPLPADIDALDYTIMEK